MQSTIRTERQIGKIILSCVLRQICLDCCPYLAAKLLSLWQPAAPFSKLSFQTHRNTQGRSSGKAHVLLGKTVGTVSPDKDHFFRTPWAWVINVRAIVPAAKKKLKKIIWSWKVKQVEAPEEPSPYRYIESNKKRFIYRILLYLQSASAGRKKDVVRPFSLSPVDSGGLGLSPFSFNVWK